MNLPLRCLLVEDSDDDAQLVLHRLRTGGFAVDASRVDNAAAMIAALDHRTWDIVISDYQMPAFTGMDALALVRARDRDLPFILLSGQMGEQMAVDAMRAGANDYLSKDHMLRLAPAVQRELHEAVARRAHRQVALALEASEAQLRFVTDHVPTMIAHCDQQRRYRFVNLPYAQRCGRQPDDLIGRHTRELMGDEIYAQADPYMTRVLAGQRVEFDVEVPQPTGECRTLHVIYAPEFAADGQVLGFLAALVDISARKLAEDLLLVSNQNLQATLDASPDLIFDMGLDGRYYDCHSPRLDLLVTSPEKLVGRLVTEVLPAEAAETVLSALREAEQNQTSTGKQLELTLAAGRKWFELSVARKAAPAGAPPRFVVLSRDISARKQVETVDAFLAQAGIDPDSEAFFPALARFLATNLQMDYTCIDRLEGDQLTATTLAAWRLGEFEDNVRYPLADTPCGRVAQQGICCYPANVTALFPNVAVLSELQAESYIGVPLLNHAGLVIGLIAVIGTHKLANPSEAEALLSRVAPRAAAELERLSVETALRESEARFRSIFAQAPMGVALIDTSTGSILEANARFATIIGRPIEELINLRWMNIANSDDIQPGLEQLRQVDAGHIPGFEMVKRHHRPDGSEVWINLTIAPITTGAFGGARHLCMVQDISERKSAEDALRTSHAVLSQFNALAVGRELRMVDLKREINELCAQLGEPPRHRIVDQVHTPQGG